MVPVINKTAHGGTAQGGGACIGGGGTANESTTPRARTERSQRYEGRVRTVPIMALTAAVEALYSR